MGIASIKPRVLILVPSSNSLGGIACYFQVIKPKFSFPVDYFIRGVRKQNSVFSKLIYPVIQICDYLRFILLLAFRQYGIIQVNTSFGKTGLIRDYFFIRIIKLFGIKYLVFFRGIDEKVIEEIEKKWFKKFLNTYINADKILVLSGDLLARIKRWKPTADISIETTVVDDSKMNDINSSRITAKYDSSITNILFLARLEKAKGIYEAIEAFKIIRKKNENVRFIICGYGKEYNNIRKITKNSNCITVTGHVSGSEKAKWFSSSHIYLFPSYREGLPNSVLEAMAYGLPVITTKVGGLVDFFEDGKMGYFLNSVNRDEISLTLERLVSEKAQALQMGLYNFEYAKSRFYSNIVVQRLQNYYMDLYSRC